MKLLLPAKKHSSFLLFFERAFGLCGSRVWYRTYEYFENSGGKYEERKKRVFSNMLNFNKLKEEYDSGIKRKI